jgi:thiamine-monophosphate kinase
MQVRELGEQGLLPYLQSFCPPGVVGDDAALLTPTPGQSLVVTTDMLVSGVHFSDQTTSPEDVGWRGAAANLSDLAAMGATPLGLVIALGLPGELELEWVQRLYQGLAECLQHYATVLVGGDICRSSQVTLGITALGQVEPTQAIQRHIAQPGDAIVATGVHGASRAGLELLLQPAWGGSLSAQERHELIRAHQRPRPRFDVVRWLRCYCSELHLPQLRVAGMDSSDGLADAVLQICRASKVGARLYQPQLPIPKPLTRLVELGELKLAQARDWLLYGGEDFELVLCLDPVAAQALVSNLPGAAVVGEVVSGQDVLLVTETGELPLSLTQGFQHFSSSAQS